MLQKLKTFLLRHEYLVWILCLCALFRVPSLLEPYWYGDEAIYLTLGHALRYGEHLYRDIFDHKPPLIYFMAAITGSVFWFRFLLIIWNSISIVVFHKFSRLLFGEEQKHDTIKILNVSFPKVTLSDVATFLFALLPFFAEGAIANAEIFFVLPILVGMFLLKRYTQEKNSIPLVIGAGIAFSIAFLLKVPPLFDAFAAGLFFFLLVPLYKERSLNLLSLQKLKSMFSSLLKPHPWIFVVSFVLPILLVGSYYFLQGSGAYFIKSTIGINVGYVSSWAAGSQEGSLSSSGLLTRGVLLLIATVLVILSIPVIPAGVVFIVLWFSYALFGALLSERPYPHYLIQIFPPMALLLVYGIQVLLLLLKRLRPSKLKKRATISLSLSFLFMILCLFALVGSLLKIKFWYYPLTPYYKNYVSFIRGQKSKDQYFAYFDTRLPEIYRTADHVLRRTTPKDHIFIWGDLPNLYALSRRVPPGRLTTSFHIKDFKGFEETIEAIETKKPKLIIVDSLYEPPFAELAAILTRDYTLLSTDTGTLVIYKRLSQSQ